MKMSNFAARDDKFLEYMTTVTHSRLSYSFLKIFDARDTVMALLDIFIDILQ